MTAEPESGYSREALQAMVERKRRNDSERRREFALLRKLRRQQGLPAAEAQVAPSLMFPSSMSSGPGERATTLKKINEIEAQMATQWRRLTGRPRPQPVAPGVRGDGQGSPAQPADSQADAVTQVRTAFDATHPPPTPRGISPGKASPRAEGKSQDTGLPDATRTAGGFSSVHAHAMDVREFVHDPEVEEAALRFASGDAAGAEAAVLALLAPGHPRADHPETWQVLFDLYRVTGQPSRYDDCAADFANRFERSPPQWRSLGVPCDLQAEPAPRGAPTPEGPSALHASAQSPSPVEAVDWVCPPVLDVDSVTALVSLLADLPQPWRLSWADMTRMEADALPGLAALVADWVDKPVKLRFLGIERLEHVVETRAVRGDSTVDPAWWGLRLDLLRATCRCDEYEMAAIDYCITYEVSPPSWELPRCEIRLQSNHAPGEADTCSGAFEEFESRVSALARGDFSSAFAQPLAGELRGVLTGDPVEVLALLEARLQGAETLLISCERLVRIDFEAAGALLNWVGARQAEGRTVHLTDLHRLVAVFLGAMGLGAQARLSVRRD